PHDPSANKNRRPDPPHDALYTHRWNRPAATPNRGTFSVFDTTQPCLPGRFPPRPIFRRRTLFPPAWSIVMALPARRIHQQLSLSGSLYRLADAVSVAGGLGLAVWAADNAPAEYLLAGAAAI